MKVYGRNQGVGYDIACSETATVAASSLKDAATTNGLQLIVNSFHGYAHKRLCQLSFHPLYLRGLGIEDLETCERIFSSLNGVARLVRHASYFHWRQFIDLHLCQWDADRYAETSKSRLDSMLLLMISQATSYILTINKHWA